MARTWEHVVIPLEVQAGASWPDTLRLSLDQYGKHGYELVAVIQSPVDKTPLAVFKKPISN